MKKRYEEGGEVDTTEGMKEAYDSRDDSAPEPRMGSGMKEKIGKGRSFKEEFAAARADKTKPKTFTWNGKQYSTKLKDTPAAKPAAKPADKPNKTAELGAKYSKMASALRTAPEGAGKRELANQTAKALSDYEGSAGTGFKKGGKIKKYASGGSVGGASRRADGVAQRGKTKCKMV